MQPLFLARKVLTDGIANTNVSYNLYSTKIKTYNEQIDKLDTLILALSNGEL